FQAGHRLVQPPGGAKRQRLRLACENGIRFEGLCRLPPPAVGILKPLPVLFRRRAALLQERKGQTSQLPRQISAPFKKIRQALRETAGRQDQGRVVQHFDVHLQIAQQFRQPFRVVPRRRRADEDPVSVALRGDGGQPFVPHRSELFLPSFFAAENSLLQEVEI